MSDNKLVPEGKRKAYTVPKEQDPYPFTRTGPLGKSVMLFALIAPLLGVAWAIVTLWGQWVTGLDIALMVILWTIAGLGVTLGYHRLLAHRAYEARAPLKLLVLIAAATSIQGRPSDWAATHIRHHARADLEGDPHSPVEGFFHAHFAWLMRDRMVREGPVWEKLHADPVTRFVDNTWGLWVALSVFAPAVIGYAFTGTLLGALQAFVWGTGVRVFVVHHLTWAVNSFGHIFGTRPHDTEDKSRNNGLLALFTWGEGWHNNHHASPRSPFLMRRWWQVDIGTYVLVILRGLGLVKGFWRPRAQIQNVAKRAKDAAASGSARANAMAKNAREAAAQGSARAQKMAKDAREAAVNAATNAAQGGNEKRQPARN